MATSPLRLMPEASPIQLMPGDDQVLADKYATEAAGGNSFTNAVTGAGLNNQASLLGDEESVLRTSGDPRSLLRADQLQSQRKALQAQAQAYAAPVGKWEDIRLGEDGGLGRAGSFVAGQLGQGLGSSIGQMATGGAMNLAASGLQMMPHPIAKAAGTALRWAAPVEMYRQNKNLLTGEAYNTVSEDPTVMANRSAQDIRDEVSTHGYRAAVMDTLPQLLPVGQLTGSLGKTIKKIPTWGKLGASAVGEGLTETGQQISQHYAHEALNPNRDTAGDLSELQNSALGGFIGGGGMGVVGHFGEKAWDRGRTVGDGKNGDTLNLNGTPTAPPAAKPSVLETMNGKPSRFATSAEFAKLSAVLEGTPPEDPVAQEEFFTAGGGVRKDALLAELTKRQEPEAAILIAKVNAVDTDQPGSVLDPAFDEAGTWLAQKLHGEITLKKNAQRVKGARIENADGHLNRAPDEPARRDSRGTAPRAPDGQEEPQNFGDTMFDSTPDMFGNNGVRVDDSSPPRNDPSHPRVGGAYTERITKAMLPDGAREKMGAVKFAAAQAEIKLHGQNTKLLTDRLWTAFRVNKGESVNADDRELVQGLAQEIMAATTVTKPTEGEARRAERLGKYLVRVVGPQAADVLTGLARNSSSKLLDVVAQHAQDMPWSGASHKQKQISRTEAAVTFTKLVPPTVEQRLLRDHGIDLNNEKDQNDLIDLVEDFHDGRSNATLMQMNKLLTAPVVKAMGLYLGNKIQPRLRGEEAVAQEHTSGATKTTDADTEGTSGGKLVSGELMGEQSEAPTEYEAVGQEKSMDRVMPESMVFHHSGNKDGSIRDIKDAWKEDAKGELPQLLREGTGAPLLERVKKLAQQAAAHLGHSRDRYVIGNPASKDPIEAAGGTSAKKLMDDTGMPDSKRAQLLFRYLAKENKDLDVGELEAMHDSVSYLGTIHRKLTDTVTNRESLSPSGEKLSIPQSAEINAPHIDYERLADLAANPADAAKVKELFKAGTISKYVGLAQIVHRAKNAAEAYLTTLPGYNEYAVKMYAEQGRTPEFDEYVNDFFSQHYAVVAEQPTNRDHLQMSLPEFREIAIKGKNNLKAVELSVLGSSMNDEAREAERLRVEASMNLIRFKSSHSRAVDSEVALPAYMLVEWVRKMRNAHEKDGENAPTKSNSPTKQTEDYKRDLMDGITTVMQNDLTDGLPWIINSKGEREDFEETALHAKPGDPKQRQLFNDGNGRSPPDFGSLPPSLDLDGTTVEKADSARAFGAAQRREAEEAHTASQSSLNEQRGLAEKEERKNAELSQDDRDVQDADSVAAAEAEATGSKTREEERANLKFMSSVMTAAADQAPRALTVGGAMNYAGRIADSLWRDYMTTGKRAEALARIMSYVRATDKEKFDEDASNDARIVQNLWAEFHKAEVDSDEQAAILKRIEEQAATTNSGKQTTTAAVGSGMVGGQHYNFPLAALLTPRHMASLNPKDVAVMTMLRSRVASELLGMFQSDPKQISGGNLGKLVNFLSGHTDRVSQDLLDKQSGTDPEIIKNRTPWQSTRIYAKGREKFLMDMAKPYQALVAKRGPAAAKNVMGWVGHPMVENQAGPGARSRETDQALARMDAVLAFAPGEDANKGALALAAKARDRTAVADASANTPIAGLNTGTAGSSSGKPIVVAKKQRVEGAQANGLNESLRSIAEPLGGARSTERNADGSIKADDDQINKDTVDINQSVDKLAGVIGNSLDARKAGVMEQKRDATTLETLPDAPQAPGHAQGKEAAKMAGADLVLAPVSAEKGFAGKLARWAKEAGRLVGAKPTGLAGKVVYVSVPGATRGWTNIDTLIARAKMALDAGATLRTDNEVNANSSHNRTGEGALRAALLHEGYVETPGEMYSTWAKGEDGEFVQRPGEAKATQNAPSFPMNYKDGQVVHSTTLRMRPEFAGKDTMDLILSGDRTATTGSLGRFNGVKKGNVVMAKGNGKQALIRFTSDPYQVKRGTNEAWSKLEGWAPEVMNEYLGQYQVTYELVNTAPHIKRNAEATRIHEELGRPGFAAAHNSPHRFDGKFNYRKNTGRGEGRQKDGLAEDVKSGVAQMRGAGTYLSTSDGTHRGYKQRFTAEVTKTMFNGDETKLATITTNIAKLEEARQELENTLNTLSDKDTIALMDLDKLSDLARFSAAGLTDRWEETGEGKNRVLYDRDEDGAYNDTLYLNHDPATNKYSVSDGRKTTGRAEAGADDAVVAFHAEMLREMKKLETEIEKIVDERRKVEDELADMNGEIKDANDEFAAFMSMNQGKSADSGKFGQGKSPTYHVSVDIKPEELFDWDKSLGKQSPLVQKAFDAAAEKIAGAATWKKEQSWNREVYDTMAVADRRYTVSEHYKGGYVLKEGGSERGIFATAAEAKAAADKLAQKQLTDQYTNAGQLYTWLSETLGSNIRASDFLQKQGVLGNVHNAQGGRQDQYRNYVIFDDNKITTNYVKFNAQATAPTAAQSAKAAAVPPKNIEVTAALAHFKRTLSDKVRVLLQDAFPDMTHGADYNTLEHLARISTANPLKIMQLAYHESMHAFFDTVLNAKGNEEIKAMMQKAMSEPKIYARLKDMLRDSPEALADMERDPEERVAYAYQFWAAGMLDIAQKPQGFFQHVQALMRRVFNEVSNSEKALAMFEAFHKGELKEPSAAGKAMLKIMQTGEWRKAFLKRFDKQAQAVYAEVMANHLVGRNSESATARTINNKFYSNPSYAGDRAHEGMINRTQMQRKKYINRLRLALRPLAGVNADRDLKALGKALNAHTTPELAHVAKAKVAVQALLKQYHEYAREAGIDIGERFGTDGDTDYFTRVLDLEKLINSKEEFTSMLMTKYAHVLKPAIGLLQRTAPEGSKVSEIDVANAIHQMYIDRNGVDDHKISAMREDGVLNPFFAASNKRELYWIRDEDIAPFLNNDVVGTMTQYISQGVRAAEYTRAFGQGGSELKDAMAREGDVQMIDKDGEAVLYPEDGPVAKELKAAAEKQGLKGKKAEEWVDRRMDDLRRSHGAYEGSLGKDISAQARKLQAGAMIYQTLRLLPLMIFSSMMDPNGIRVAGGTSDDMWDAYKRGFTGLWTNYKDMFLGNPFGSRDPDAKEMAALESGVIDSDMELEEMGQVHSSEYSSGMTRHISHAFFKAIGITQWDRDMRISATDAARKSIVSSYNNEVPAHSARWLEEAGLKRGQVYINAAGELIVSARELALKNNISRTEAAKLLEPTHLAINTWVNRAIVSPNAGLRPTRFSDPHFAMFAQFKSFTYAFQETTLRYAMHEAEQGNFNSGAQLLRGIPIMIAADMTKAMVTGGGSLPGYMANWTMADWISHAINRSGIGGTGTFATDILGGDIVNTLAGPTVGHAWDTVEKVATGDAGKAITNSIPLVKQFAGGLGHARHALEAI